MVVGQRVMVCVRMLFLWVRYFMGVNQVLDLMPKASAAISFVTPSLMEVTIQA